MYKVQWEREALKSLDRINWKIAEKIRAGVETVLAKNPYGKGKPLKGERKGQWRFRFSEYRVIYKIEQDKLLILVVEIGHRREIY